MNKKVYIVADSIISSLDFGSQKNMEALYQGRSGLKMIDDAQIYPEAFMGARLDQKLFNRCFGNVQMYNQLDQDFEFTRFEKMAIMALGGIFRQIEFPKDSRTLMILSSTKGNIDLLAPQMLEKWGKERSMLWKAAQMIADFWGLEHKPRVISNACVSGVEAIHFGAQFIKQGLYENVLVVGADMLTEFVVSGFMSFQSLSPQQCKPFDEARDGLNLGEAAAAMWLTSNSDYLKANMPVIEVLGGASSNDANHISGPSRTGDGQFFAIDSAMKEAGLMAKDIDYISAHGTATPYNDEMESKALNLAGLHEKPVNSMKAYFGHTLGAAGVLESVVTCKNLRDQKILRSLGYQYHGVSLPLNVISETKEWPMKYALKTASGFGGCNAAVIFSNSSRR